MSMPRKEQLPGVFDASLSEDDSFTVQDLLGLPLLAQARLIAGERGSRRSVTRVNVMETPDAVPRVHAGEFLMTAAHPFPEEPQRFRQLISELARRGGAGLGIIAKGIADEVPAEAAEEAEACGFPLLVLPPDTAFSDVVRDMMERMIARETDRLADLQNRIRSMTRFLLEGNGLYAFLDAMEQMFGNPVAVVRENDKPWVSVGLRGGDPTETWPILQSLQFRQLGRGTGNGFQFIGGVNRAYVGSIPSSRGKLACLVLLERDRGIAPLDALSVDRLASLAGMELANVEAVREVEGKYLDQFLQDWLTGRIVSETDWRMRADVCGCNIAEGASLCAVLVSGSAARSPEKMREVARRLRSERLRSVEGLLASPVDGDLALVVPMSPPESGDADDREFSEPALGRLLQELRPIMEDPGLRLFAGRTVHRSEGLNGSWLQAKRTRQVAEVCGLSGDLLTYDRLGVYSLLYLIPTGEEREQFLRRYSQPLHQADRKGGGRLVETMEMFFRCNGNIKLTSEKLYAHYNTVVYRLEKIQNILGVSLDDPEDRLQLHLALKLGQITPNSTA